MRFPILAVLAAPAMLAAQRPQLSNAVRPYVSIDTPTFVITHVRIIDGTGAPAKDDQTIAVENGKITSIRPSAEFRVPSSALVIDGAGKTVMPGLVMVHEHLFYPSGPGVYGNFTESFSRLYLAGGVTSMRT